MANEIAMQLGNLGFYFRLSVQQGLQIAKNLDIPLSTIASVTSEYLQDPEVTSKLEQCVTSLEFRLGLTTLEQLKYSGGGKVAHRSLPPITTNFVERHEPWSTMVKALIDSDSLDTQRILVISGLGGCGKSTLVTKFAAEYQSKFEKFFFIDSTSASTVRADLIESVRSIGGQYSQVTLEGALAFFSSPKNRNWALIYDNADDVSLDLAPLLPNANHGVILITTRNRLLAQLASSVHLELDIMSKEESIEALARSSRREGKAEDSDWLPVIAEEVGYLPVALIQAGSYMFQTGCSGEDYVKILRENRREMMETPASAQRDRTHHSAYSAFDMSYAKITSQIQNFLHIISFFHPSNFPLAVIPLAAKADFLTAPVDLGDKGEHFEEAIALLKATFCPGGSWQDRTIYQILSSLQNYSLAAQNSAYGTILLRTHPLIHSWANDRIPSEKVPVFRAAACRLLACACQEVLLETHIMQHIDTVLSTSAPIALNDKAAFGQKLTTMLRLEDGTAIWEEIYQELLGRHGRMNLYVATAAIELAATFDENLDRMEELETQAVEIRTALLGADDEQTLRASLELAGTYHRQGLYPKAEQVQQRILDLRRERLGEHHEDTIYAKDELASTFRETYRYKESEKLQQEILREHIKQHGDSHPKTLTSMNELGILKYYQYQHEEAQEILTVVLKKREEMLGREHPMTLVTLNDLALVFVDQAKYKEAEEIHRQVLRVRLRMGKTQPETILCMENLVDTLSKMEKFPEALKMQRRVMKLRIASLGIFHHLTVESLSNLAYIYRLQGRLAKSNKLLSAAFPQVRQHHGKDHSTTLLLMNELSVLNAKTRRLHKAASYGRYVLVKRAEQLGETHSHTLLSARNLLDTYKKMNRHRLASVLLMRWLQGGIRELGEADAETKFAVIELGTTLRKLKRYRDAEQIQLYSLERVQELSGDKPEEWWNEVKQLATTYDVQKRYCKSRDLRERVLEKWKPGDLDHDYLHFRLDQCNTLHKMGRKKDALALLDGIISPFSSAKTGDEKTVDKTLDFLKRRRNSIAFTSSRLRIRRRFRYTGRGDGVDI
ncbi:hypothetical protein FRC16_007375 [Serendipita sp. 398]|nr:hypothetical protein FRC16_007375 [Serendipita sp. 398]